MFLQQQEKNKVIVQQNQQEKGEVLQENIPADELGGATPNLGAEETKGGDDEDATVETSMLNRNPEDYADDMSVLTGDNMNEEEKMIEFLETTIFKLKGVSKFNASQLKKNCIVKHLLMTQIY